MLVLLFSSWHIDLVRVDIITVITDVEEVSGETKQKVEEGSQHNGKSVYNWLFQGTREVQQRQQENQPEIRCNRNRAIPIWGLTSRFANDNPTSDIYLSEPLELRMILGEGCAYRHNHVPENCNHFVHFGLCEDESINDRKQVNHSL
jgi:hypothetical protein